MDIHHYQIENIPVLRPARTLTRKNYNELPGFVASLLAEQGRGVVIDLLDVNFLDSTGISLLLSAKKIADAANARIALCNVSPAIVEIFDRLNLTSVFLFFSSPEPAAAALAQHP